MYKSKKMGKRPTLSKDGGHTSVTDRSNKVRAKTLIV